MKKKVSIYGIPSLAGIEQVVAWEYDLMVEQLSIYTRKRQIKEARQICMWWRQKYTKESLAQIGMRYASADNPTGYDHATVLHAKKTINNLMDSDKEFNEKIELIKQRVFLLTRRTASWNYMKSISQQIEDHLNYMGEMFDEVKVEANGFAPEFSDLHFLLTTVNRKMKNKFLELAQKSKQEIFN